MSDATKAMHDFLTKSPSVVFPDEVLELFDPVEAENRKLRELVRGLYWCNDKEWNKGACDDCPIRGRATGRCERVMRELGIEVEK